MGCCVSTHALYDGQQGDASSRNPIISSQPPANPSPSDAQSIPPHPQGNRRPKADKTPSVKPNKELKRLVWESEDRTWTRQQIDQEREDFFFTRVTGREEVWQTIKTALEVIWAGGDTADHDGGLKTAQLILNAASITLPHSTLDRGVYDITGAFYPLPKYIVCDPTNLVFEPLAIAYDDGSKNEETGSEAEDEEVIQRRREEKGKGIADPDNEEIQLKARRSDGGTHDLVIVAGKKDTVRQLLRKFNESGELAPPKRVQLWYLGHLLKEDQNLLEQGWKEGHMLQAFVHG